MKVERTIKRYNVERGNQVIAEFQVSFAWYIAMMCVNMSRDWHLALKFWPYDLSDNRMNEN